MTKDGLIRQVLIAGVSLAAVGCATATVQPTALEQRVIATHVSVMMLPERATELTQDFIAADPAHAAEITAAAVTSAPQQRDAIMAAGIAAAPGQEAQIRMAVAEATLSAAALPVQVVRTYPPVAPAYFEPFPLAWPRTYNWDFSQPLRR